MICVKNNNIERGNIMKFISWNVNGLRAVVTKGFEKFLELSDGIMPVDKDNEFYKKNFIMTHL